MSLEILKSVGLDAWTWWKVGGPADFFCLPATKAEVLEAIEFARARGVPITVLGDGTNVLISDEGVAGLVVCMKHLTGMTVSERDGRLFITALAGTPKSELTKIFLRHKLAPALFLCGLPGNVGGGIVMNAGIREAIMPREFVEITDWVEWVALGGECSVIRKLDAKQLQWSYRDCSGWRPGLLLEAGFSWSREPDPEISAKVKEATKKRIRTQPLDMPSCGSTFKNPADASAGQLIEQAGLKGFRIGGAQVSEKHANFIVNVGGATAKDIDAVIRHVKSQISSRFKVDLEAEVKYLGRWGG